MKSFSYYNIKSNGTDAKAMCFSALLWQELKLRPHIKFDHCSFYCMENNAGMKPVQTPFKKCCFMSGLPKFFCALFVYFVL